MHLLCGSLDCNLQEVLLNIVLQTNIDSKFALIFYNIESQNLHSIFG